MERRLLKDFQIGMVEGLIQEAITSNEKGPKDVFSKIAKAIGRKASQGSKKKDWNAMARQKSVIRDPIGSTAEGVERRHRQSVRRYILDHQKDSLLSMDPEKLVEYNPLLAEIAPAARVAYAKFKIPKIKQEYEDNTVGPDDVFENAPTVDVVDETAKKSSSIVRPRPKSARKSPAPGALPFPVGDKPEQQAPSAAVAKQPTPATAPDAAGSEADQKPKASERKDPAPKPGTGPSAPGSTKTRSAPRKPEETRPSTSSAGEKSAAADSDGKPRDGDDKDAGKREGGASKPDEDPKENDDAAKKDRDPKEGDEGSNEAAGDQKERDAGSKESDGEPKGGDKDSKKPAADGDKDKGKDEKKEAKPAKPESPKRSGAPKKMGGKSKVTGEILTGWL